jgi:hypothetical protein
VTKQPDLIATIPEEKFETYIAETQTFGRELTTAG